MRTSKSFHVITSSSSGCSPAPALDPGWPGAFFQCACRAQPTVYLWGPSPSRGLGCEALCCLGKEMGWRLSTTLKFFPVEEAVPVTFLRSSCVWEVTCWKKRSSLCIPQDHTQPLERPLPGEEGLVSGSMGAKLSVAGTFTTASLGSLDQPPSSGPTHEMQPPSCLPLKRSRSFGRCVGLCLREVREEKTSSCTSRGVSQQVPRRPHHGAEGAASALRGSKGENCCPESLASSGAAGKHPAFPAALEGRWRWLNGVRRALSKCRFSLWTTGPWRGQWVKLVRPISSESGGEPSPLPRWRSHSWWPGAFCPRSLIKILGAAGVGHELPWRGSTNRQGQGLSWFPQTPDQTTPKETQAWVTTTLFSSVFSQDSPLLQQPLTLRNFGTMLKKSFWALQIITNALRSCHMFTADSFLHLAVHSRERRHFKRIKSTESCFPYHHSNHKENHAQACPRQLPRRGGHFLRNAVLVGHWGLGLAFHIQVLISCEKFIF